MRKIKTIKSDLFENVEGHFNVILFNPPYLPQDKGIEDIALYGGKKGWEISEKFFNEVSKYLFSDGRMLFLFSSLTNKEKINEIIDFLRFNFYLTVVFFSLLMDYNSVVILILFFLFI